MQSTNREQLSAPRFDRTQDLVARIDRIVRCRAGGGIQDLRVEVIPDGVVLTGVANSYYAKQLATHAALDEIEDRSLTNDIQVG